jgi:protein-disulfide isomerase
MLFKLIDNLLLRQAALEEGIELHEYLRENVEEGVEISDGEIEQSYQSNVRRFSGALPAEAKYRIRRILEDNQRADRLRSLLTTLRGSAKIVSYIDEAQAKSVEAILRDSGILPNPGIPLTIVQFSDFECPYCRMAYAQLADLLDRHRGKVQIVTKHLPSGRHRNAVLAAKASICGKAQGELVRLDAALFGKGQDLSGEGILQVADQLGLDLNEFSDCLAGSKSDHLLQEDVQLAGRLGVAATPAIFINGRRLSAVSELSNMVEEFLAVEASGGGQDN